MREFYSVMFLIGVSLIGYGLITYDDILMWGGIISSIIFCYLLISEV